MTSLQWQETTIQLYYPASQSGQIHEPELNLFIGLKLKCKYFIYLSKK